jgi:hypothetical protein
MGQIIVLECLLSGMCGHLRPCLVLPSIKWHLYSRTMTLRPLPQYLGYLREWLPGARAHAQLGCEGMYRLGWQVVKSCLPMVTEMGRRTGADCSWV